MRVDHHIGGSHCVVWKHQQHYLDCRKTLSYGGTSATTIEAVRNGQVYRSIQVLDDIAPETIIKWIKEELS